MFHCDPRRSLGRRCETQTTTFDPAPSALALRVTSWQGPHPCPGSRSRTALEEGLRCFGEPPFVVGGARSLVGRGG